VKKLIIISYFYPPAAFVGGERTQYWAENLHKHGYYPVVITRQWNKGQKDLVNRINHNQHSVEKYETYEVHRLPYNRSLRDKCAPFKWLKPIQKLLTLCELVFSNYFLSVLPYSNFFSYAKGLIEKDKNIQLVLISGRPFRSFFFGYRLKKVFPHIHWVADYRDEWTTSRNKTPGFINGFIRSLERNSEKRWLSNASLFINVSEKWKPRIENLTETKGKEVKNGYIENIKPLGKGTFIKPADSFQIAYVGTLYQNQEIESFLKVLNQIKKEITLYFIGSELIPSEKYRLQQLAKKYDFLIRIQKLSKQELYNNLQNIDLFFATPYANVDGCLPVKAFDYLILKKPIILYPSDNDVFEEFILDTQSGIIAANEIEAENIIADYIKKKKNGELKPRQLKNDNIQKYSRAYQTRRLASFLTDLTENS
jgi:glycosyltransferase involved in cell wall biosynthesis